jgi:hypothetical protein
LEKKNKESEDIKKNLAKEIENSKKSYEDEKEK